MISKENRTIAIGQTRLDYKQIIQKVILFLDENIFNFPEYYQNSETIRSNEKSINSCLGVFLNNVSRKKNEIDTFFFYFDKDTQVEDSEHEPDFGVMLANEKSKGNSFFHIECKRLPARDKEHEQEYIHGKLGGIERFKRGHHGADFPSSAMVAYIEKETPTYWFSQINTWIESLIHNQPDFWMPSEILTPISAGNYNKLTSNHIRKYTETKIQLHHYWVSLENKGK